MQALNIMARQFYLFPQPITGKLYFITIKCYSTLKVLLGLLKQMTIHFLAKSLSFGCVVVVPRNVTRVCLGGVSFILKNIKAYKSDL